MSDRVDEIVTKFMLNTCRLRPRFSPPVVLAAARCVELLEILLASIDQDEVDVIPLTTGSVAEFYIEPMLPHVGDIDVMYRRGSELAIPRGHPPPTLLPTEFHNYVRVFEIIDSHFPGYVYLKLRYLLTECEDDGRYNAMECDEQLCLFNRWHSGDHNNNHGPAIVHIHPFLLSLDAVHCVRCLVWPPQAADWPTRHRNYGWPDSATVERVVSDGCDMVGVAHRQCREHEWMGERQWRLSFSRAEIVLINSWMPVQQIVYHILRVFIKTERLTDSANNTGACVLSNYHIKTLMLWACETKSRNWWTDRVNIVKMCGYLLHIFGDWVTDAWCQHYFINNCNLIDNSFNLTIVGGQMMSIDEEWLSKWFVDNYIRKCFQLCPDNLLRLFDDVSTSTKLQHAVSAVVDWRLNNTPLDAWDMLTSIEMILPEFINDISLSAPLCARWMNELANVDSCLSVYFKAVAFLHVSNKLSRHGLNDAIMDVLTTLHRQHICWRHYSNNTTSMLLLNKAANLTKEVTNKSLSTTSLITIELSKAYLYRALRRKDSNSDSIYCLANVYLAVLYYTTGHYQTAKDHCAVVMRSQDHSQCSSHVVQGERLPKSDDNVDNVLGLAVFYQHVRTAALNTCHSQHVSVLKTELFAYYLNIKCQSLTVCRQYTRTLSTEEFRRYENCLSDNQQLFICDVLLFVSLNQLLKQTFHHRPVQQQSPQMTMNSAEYNVSDLVQLLVKSAVEYLTTFRHIQVRDFSSVATIVTTDFEALYAYKHGDYQQCLQLCTQNVHILLYDYKKAIVAISPEFIQLMDDDIVSVTALTLIVNPECRHTSDYFFISQPTLLLYLMTQCQLKLRHSVTSLAQTLDYIKSAIIMHRRDGNNLSLVILKMTTHKVRARLSRITYDE